MEHTDGQFRATSFPKLIAPSQPFLDIRKLSGSAVDSNSHPLEVRFDGDTSRWKTSEIGPMLGSKFTARLLWHGRFQRW